MRLVSVELFARRTRREERARTAPFYVIGGGIGLGSVLPVFWGYWAVPLYVLANIGIAGAYLAAYIAEIRKGRTYGCPPGRVALVDDVIEITMGDLATRLALPRVVGAKFFMCDHFDDFKGLHDVIELHVVSGARVRIPDALDGFGAFLDALRERRGVTYV